MRNADQLAAADRFIAENILDDGSGRVWPKHAAPIDLRDAIEISDEADVVIALPPTWAGDAPREGATTLKSGWRIGAA